MWSLDWFAARELARKGTAIRRVGWERGTWLAYFGRLWQVRLPDLTWRVATAADFAEKDFRARDWTDESYRSNICGAMAAYNTAPLSEGTWGDAPEMRPRPVPNYAEEEA